MTKPYTPRMMRKLGEPWQKVEAKSKLKSLVLSLVWLPGYLSRVYDEIQLSGKSRHSRPMFIADVARKVKSVPA